MSKINANKIKELCTSILKECTVETNGFSFEITCPLCGEDNEEGYFMEDINHTNQCGYTLAKNLINEINNNNPTSVICTHNEK